MSVVTAGPVVFAADEIARSSDPAAHARNTAFNLAADGILGLALQVGADNERAAALVKPELRARGRWFGGWAQGLDPAVELDTIRRWGCDFYVCNIETKAEYEAWSEARLDELLALRLPQGVAVIFTEGAFVWPDDVGQSDEEKLRRRRARAARWISRGIDAIPEASRPDNPLPAPNGGREIEFMLFLAGQLGWAAASTNVCVYLTRATPASHYSPQIGMTGGRWSVFRLGDIDDADRQVLRAWPRPAAPPPPPPPPDPAEGVRAKIEALLADPAELTTADMNALVAGAVFDAWARRQARLGNPVTRKQRASVNKRVAASANDRWLAADDDVVAALDRHTV